MKKFIFIIFIIILLPFNVQADSIQKSINEDDLQIQHLYDYITNMKTDYEVLKDLEPKEFVEEFIKSGNSKISFKKVSQALLTYTFKDVVALFKSMAILIVISIVCALLNNLQNSFSKNDIGNIAYFACYALMIVIISKSFYGAASVAKDTIIKITDFMAAIIPVLMMLLATVGGFTQATIMDPIIITVINISSRIYINIIIPIIFMSFVLQFVNNISEEFKINKLTKLLSQIALWAQGIIMTIFIGVLTIRGITSKTIDQVTAKTAKYAVDNFVPIVGKALSDAISTVAGYSLLLKNAISGLGLIIILLLVIFPVFKILAMSFVYKLTAAFIEPVSDSRIVSCLTSVGDALILLMSCVISISTMFFIMITIIASAGKIPVGG
ncbi:stage III sporulation protein AE [Clostridium sp. USBA 49]|jgi:stage III sporulation protein AE|uniref:stage III sporulation protein AE n=1 Tax=Clostridium TaxID=1485 RepID=UPI0009997DD0|nr:MULTISPECIES: stage III sporulation protein AE [Clostridium]SKA76812.1 stage III sporulation protein AE [Clostridium sp. USBA 49]